MSTNKVEGRDVSAAARSRMSSVLASTVPLGLCAMWWFGMRGNEPILETCSVALHTTALYSFGPCARMAARHLDSPPLILLGAIVLWIAWLTILALTPVGKVHPVVIALVSTLWMVAGAIVGMYAMAMSP